MIDTDTLKVVGAILTPIASIIAALCAKRAASTAKKAEAATLDVKAMIQAQDQRQRQVQQVNINLQTSGAAKGGEVIDLSGGPSSSA
jgi:type II secretory pathway pseudopilin PulG